MSNNVFKLQVAGITKTVSLKIKVTNLVLYGSGFIEPNAGNSHNTGDAFKEIAKARHEINKTMNPTDINEVHFCPTDFDFFNIINNSNSINRLDVYCHGWLHGLNLGGFRGKRIINSKEIDGDKLDWTDKGQNKGKDLRRVEIHENLYLNSTETTELINLKSNSFNKNTNVYFWGCNIGGQLDSKGKHIANNKPLINDPKKSFAQKFAEKIGKGNVYSLVGKGGIH
jgi:hypothetical protein